ncbi:MAG TPA: SDR family NAD(P)-dependent oxidoreductase [Pirellulales bacterium]|nr:SDR family NAD(P)-dependent oxidoreductase [Pirellulales bacterium]
MKILITGGAGFIGSRLAQALAADGAEVTVLDNLSPQVHGAEAEFPSTLRKVANCIKGDVGDAELIGKLLDEQQVVVHFAAETGTGQSMYAVDHYARVNVQGTAVLLDRLVNHRPTNLRKLIVASSRAVYGEGEYQCASHGRVYPAARTVDHIAAGRFDCLCPECGGTVEPVATTERARLQPSSFYGLTKQVQEQMVLMFASSLGIDAFALRFQNVYGPGQSLTNPYTGILAIFSNLVRQGLPLNIFEDGLESRDFVYIDDIITATTQCIDPNVHGVEALNVGSGSRTAVIDVARSIATYFEAQVPINVTGTFRVGDIRHNFADISRIASLTGFVPRWSFDEGLKQFLGWAETHRAAEAGYDRSLAELRTRGLLTTG